MGPAVKAELRRAALLARAAGGDQDALTENLASALAGMPGATLAGYWPMRDEADPRPAMARHRGPICLPVVTGPARPLVFRLYDGTLEPGSFGTSHPPDDAPEVTPDILIVPLAGFDRSGHRLGYGGGFYDRTLHQLRAKRPVIAIGLAFAVQEIRAIPAEPTDERLDHIVTDREILDFG